MKRTWTETEMGKAKMDSMAIVNEWAMENGNELGSVSDSWLDGLIRDYPDSSAHDHAMMTVDHYGTVDDSWRLDISNTVSDREERDARLKAIVGWIGNLLDTTDEERDRWNEPYSTVDQAIAGATEWANDAWKEYR